MIKPPFGIQSRWCISINARGDCQFKKIQIGVRSFRASVLAAKCAVATALVRLHDD